MREVQSPLLVGRRQDCPRRTAADTVLALLTLQAQPCFSIHPEQTLMVHRLPFMRQQHLEPPIAIARLVSRQRDKSLPQIFIAPHGLVSITRYSHRQKPAYPALADQKLLPQPASIRPSVYELRPFLAITAFNISRSRLKSATSRFSWLFSSSRERTF